MTAGVDLWDIGAVLTRAFELIAERRAGEADRLLIETVHHRDITPSAIIRAARELGRLDEVARQHQDV